MKILEIGPGEDPMILYGGAVFEMPGVDYHAIEPVPGYVDVANQKLAENLSRFAGRVVVADSAQIPLEDETVDLVIMKDVFGEYTMSPEWTGSLVENTRKGVFEYFRVLKPNGKIVVIEENTPDKLGEATDVASGLIRARFRDLKYFPRHHKQNTKWQAERREYIKPTPTCSGISLEIPSRIDDFYIMTASRPVSPGHRLFKATVGNNEVKQRWRLEREAELPLSEGTLAIDAEFQVSALEPICDPRDPEIVRSHVRVYCDKSGIHTLQDEYKVNGWLFVG